MRSTKKSTGPHEHPSHFSIVIGGSPTILTQGQSSQTGNTSLNASAPTLTGWVSPKIHCIDTHACGSLSDYDEMDNKEDDEWRRSNVSGTMHHDNDVSVSIMI